VTSLSAYLSYRDAPVAIDWLRAIGFQVVARQSGEAGSVVHAELRQGGAVVMLATADAYYATAPLLGRSTGSGLYLAVDDVGAVYAAAVDAGATPVLEPGKTEWGDRAGSRPRSRGPRVVLRDVRSRLRLVSDPLGTREVQVATSP
jgi:uncharacterized glyoxalase superfamily protein PhnB